MPIFGKKINVCKMCESTAGDKPFTFKSGEKICCLCDDCYHAVESVCKKVFKKLQPKKKKTKKKIKTKPKENVKKVLESSKEDSK